MTKSTIEKALSEVNKAYKAIAEAQAILIAARFEELKTQTGPAQPSAAN